MFMNWQRRVPQTLMYCMYEAKIINGYKISAMLNCFLHGLCLRIRLGFLSLRTFMQALSIEQALFNIMVCFNRLVVFFVGGSII